MKSTSSTPWSCRIVRAWRTTIASDSSESQGFGSSHMAQCPECRAHFAADDALESALRQQAPARFETPRVGLEQRIMRAVTESAQPAPRQRRSQGYSLMLAGAAAAIAVAFTFLQTRQIEPNTRAELEAFAGTQNVGAPEADTPMERSSVSLAEFATPVTTALAEHSLQSEVDLVYADARKAVQFLAVNFLPPGAASQRNGG